MSNNISSNSTDIGGLKHFLYELDVYLPYIILTSISALFGILGIFLNQNIKYFLNCLILIR